MTKHLLIIAGGVFAVALIFFPTFGFGATRHDTYPLHLKSAGPRVAALQWLMTGHKPSVYRGIHPYAGQPTGYFGAATATAVKRTKYKLGYPAADITPTASWLILSYLKGERKRPTSYVLRAASRLKADAAAAAARTRRATMQTRIVTIAKRYIGVSEYPMGSNCGRTVNMFQSSTGAYCAAWCASFMQYVLKAAGYGTIAYRSAHVYTIKSYAIRRGWTRSQKPRPASIVVFNSWQGHIGIVSLVTAGGFWSIEGNASNRVLSRFHPWGARSVTFIQLPF